MTRAKGGHTRMIREIGLTLSAIAMLAVSVEFLEQPVRSGPVFRILALAGETLYFTNLMPRIGAFLFLASAAITVFLWFRAPDSQSHQKSLIEIIELVAWLWMALALH